jgi:hypothetical protein
MRRRSAAAQLAAFSVRRSVRCRRPDARCQQQKVSADASKQRQICAPTLTGREQGRRNAGRQHRRRRCAAFEHAVTRGASSATPLRVRELTGTTGCARANTRGLCAACTHLSSQEPGRESTTNGPRRSARARAQWEQRRRNATTRKQAPRPHDRGQAARASPPRAGATTAPSRQIRQATRRQRGGRGGAEGTRRPWPSKRAQRHVNSGRRGRKNDCQAPYGRRSCGAAGRASSTASALISCTERRTGRRTGGDRRATAKSAQLSPPRARRRTCPRHVLRVTNRHAHDRMVGHREKARRVAGSMSQGLGAGYQRVGGGPPRRWVGGLRLLLPPRGAWGVGGWWAGCVERGAEHCR